VLTLPQHEHEPVGLQTEQQERSKTAASAAGDAERATFSSPSTVRTVTAQRGQPGPARTGDSEAETDACRRRQCRRPRA
jgi:hypothetical protein